MIELKKYLAFLTIIIGFCNPVLAHSFLAQSLMSFDEVIEKAKKEKNDTLLANALYNKVAIFYNQAMDDSVIYYVPQYLIEIRKIKQWNKYYEMWTHLANTYLYSGQPNKALREVQAIFDDAKKQNNTFGMGIAYYTMGSVYTSLNDLD
jgi:tetratricopeptide (TPR) repeat protein